jgi:hypothetical protein
LENGSEKKQKEARIIVRALMNNFNNENGILALRFNHKSK